MHTLITRQILNASVKYLWEFMQSPHNLEKITPASLQFRILNEIENDIMYNGQIVNYQVSPLFGIPLNWSSELKFIHPPFFFVDTQIEGPYKVWHHQHILKEINKNQTEMIDIVNYKLPLGIFGNLLNKLFIRKKVENIFSYRSKMLDELFNQQKNL